ncbi:MAG TPA: Flp pilus assembly protein CpaB [Acidimicrobiales bacterium]|nr:Flp pilus assembly protein CpaB [Acidimicrobiales bacterium]
MTTRTKTALVVGLVIFLVGGGGAAYLATRPSSTPVRTTGQVEVFYTTAPIGVGTAGATALADGRIRTKKMPSRPAAAVTSSSQMSGRVAASAIPVGSIVTADMFPAPQTSIGTVVIPAGKRALSLKLGSVQGVSGFVAAGDRIDVYRVSKSEVLEPLPPAYVELALQGVEVLKVDDGAAAGADAAAAQPKGGDLTFLVAVSPEDAEKLIYLTEFEHMYFDLVPRDSPTVQTPGAGPGRQFQIP